MGAETKKQKKQEDSNRSPWLDGYKTLGELISCLIFVTILFVFAIRLVGVVGDSMYPTLHNGDKLTLLSNFLYEPEVGDIVVLKAPDFDDDKPIVKRVIAMAGQTVDIDFTTGEVFVDGVLQDEPLYQRAHLSGQRHPVSPDRAGELHFRHGRQPKSFHRQPRSQNRLRGSAICTG